LINSAGSAAAILDQARRKWPAESGLAFAVTRARNTGAQIVTTPRA
jgi:hypothetical protein